MPVAASLHYLVHNQGAVEQPPVLLIHGAGGDHLYWPPQVRRMAYGRIFAVDLPGHGLSGRLGCQRMEDYARSLIYLLDALGISRAVVVGHSMGGGIALQMALDWPQRVLALGLVATGAHLPVSPQLLDAFSREETVARGIDIIMKWAFSPSADEKLRRLARRRMEKIRPPVLHGDFIACNAFDVRARLGEIAAPALILAGSADKMTPVRFAEGLRTGLPRARLRLFSQAGHMLMLERPEETARTLSEWLRALHYHPGM